MLCKNPISICTNPQAFQWTRAPEKFAKFFEVPCGSCSTCRYNMTKYWALRIALEAMMHKQNSFLTLTYNPENMPEGETLVKKHLQDFMKRLRGRLEYHHGVEIRFFAAGEYGDKNDRPHYHVLIFGWDFPDKTFFKTSVKGARLYRSALLEELWPYGFSSIGALNYQSAKYAAGYCRKKITGKAAADHYGEREPEFAIFSKHPKIGDAWYQQNKHWLWKEDRIEMFGRTFRPPIAFEETFKKEDPEAYAEWVLETRSKRTKFDDGFYVESPSQDDTGTKE